MGTGAWEHRAPGKPQTQGRKHRETQSAAADVPLVKKKNSSATKIMELSANLWNI